MTKRRWIWVTYLILLVALLAILATRWNMAWIESPERKVIEPLLGTLGFVIIIAGVILFFARLLQEMRLNQLQSEFLAAVTHELKTPIATLELSSNLLRQTPDLSPEETEKLWQSHRLELDRLKSEVETLLEAARWDARSVKTQRSKINLAEWIQLRLPFWQSNLRNGEIIQTGPKLDLSVYVDPKILNLIADNLIDNARKFARDTPKITIHTRILENQGFNKNKKWQIEFRDEGWGFDPKESKKIFKRFHRSRHQAPYSIPGTGLGLFLAHSASRRMGISLHALSPGHGMGASFFLEGHIDEELSHG
jgi:signal transduction histidine kinase